MSYHKTLRIKCKKSAVFDSEDNDRKNKGIKKRKDKVEVNLTAVGYALSFTATQWNARSSMNKP